MKKYDLIVIGLGPAGMAVSIMGSEMGLSVCGIEKHKIGGECMNVGCIPSKSILRMSKNRNKALSFLKNTGIDSNANLDGSLFDKIQDFIKYINDKKTVGMFNKVDLKLGKSARFINKNVIKVGDEEIFGKKIYICTGTKPAVPPIEGIDKIDFLTNDNIFHLDKIPKSMTIIGGGAIGSEMAQAFSRLGSKITVVHMDPNLMYGPQRHPKTIVEDIFEKENIKVLNSRKILKAEKDKEGISIFTDKGEIITSEKLLIAAGRSYDFSDLDLDKAGIKYSNRGIKVNNYLQTNRKNIYAPGDVNGHFLLSHAAMHQGMLALMNSMMPWPFKKNFKNYVVPWTVFTDPQVSSVGKSEYELKKNNIKYEVVEVKYEDYGAAIAEEIGVGYVRVFCSTFGKIYGAQIIGEGSGEMINEFALAIQNNLKMYNIMFLQHSFPTMSFLIKRVSETWMMNRMKSKFLQKICKVCFRVF